MSQRAQFAVRKQGSTASGNWSTRTLTIDTDTCTVTVSRRNHPNNLLYHSMEVKVVQMWPRFLPDTLDDDYQSLKAKMTLRVLGKEVPVPYFTADDAAVTNTSTLSRNAAGAAAAADRARGGKGGSVASTDTPPPPFVAPEFAFIAGDATKKSRPLMHDGLVELYEVWMLRFTTIESYEAAVTLLGCLRNQDGTVRQVFGEHVAKDLAAVKLSWFARFNTHAAVSAQLSNQLSKDQIKASAH